jgi:hypothetical protein
MYIQDVSFVAAVAFVLTSGNIGCVKPFFSFETLPEVLVQLAFSSIEKT